MHVTADALTGNSEIRVDDRALLGECGLRPLLGLLETSPSHPEVLLQRRLSPTFVVHSFVAIVVVVVVTPLQVISERQKGIDIDVLFSDILEQALHEVHKPRGQIVCGGASCGSGGGGGHCRTDEERAINGSQTGCANSTYEMTQEHMQADAAVQPESSDSQPGALADTQRYCESAAKARGTLSAIPHQYPPPTGYIHHPHQVFEFFLHNFLAEGPPLKSQEKKSGTLCWHDGGPTHVLTGVFSGD